MTQDKDPIQKAIDVLDDVSSDYDLNGFGARIEEALSALRGMKAVDVEGLKKRPKDKNGPLPYSENPEWSKGWNTCLDHLTSNGYVIMKAGE